MFKLRVSVLFSITPSPGICNGRGISTTTGKVDVQMDKSIRKRILEVTKFNEDDKNHIFSVIDAFVAKRKIQSIM